MDNQTSVRQRASISLRFTNLLLRTETQNSTTGRVRSDSNISTEVEEEKTIKHPVEPRARTAILPPVFVRMLLSLIT
jgi:catabolite repression protein CreC